MSSTNRGYDRHKSDYYVTPLETIYRFFNAYEHFGFDPTYYKVLDPCAGGGVINGQDFDMPYPKALKSKYNLVDANIITIDIREDSKADVKCNFLDFDSNELGSIGKFDLIITNPPFDQATEIVEQAVRFLNDKPNSRIVMLQRINWLGSKARQQFWDKHNPEYIFVDNKRPSFGGTRSTDSIEYAHFVFKKEPNPTTQMVMVHRYN